MTRRRSYLIFHLDSNKQHFFSLWLSSMCYLVVFPFLQKAAEKYTSRYLSALTTNTTNHKKRPTRVISTNLQLFSTISGSFRNSFFCIGTRCSVGSQIILCDKQSETCQNNLQLCRNLCSHNQIKITNMSLSCNMIEFCVILSTKWYISHFFIFCVSTRCSARFQIIFHDKQSETRQNFLQFSRNLCSYNQTKNHKTCHFLCNIIDFRVI